MDCPDGDDIREIGYHTWDILENLLVLDRVCTALCGITEAEGAEGMPIEAFLMRIATPSRERVAKSIHDSLLHGSFYLEEYPLILEAGGTRWVRVEGRLIYDREGIPVRGIGTMVDITDEMMALEATRQ